MKTKSVCAVLVFLCTASTIEAQTNILKEINFNNKIASFSDLRGHRYSNVVLVRGNSDGIVWKSGSGLGLVSYTNLSSEVLELLGIPTNYVQTALLRAQKRSVSQSAFRAQQAIAVEKQAQDNAAAIAAYEADAPKRRLAQQMQQMENDAKAIANLKAQIAANRKRSRDLWRYYIDTPSEYSSTTSGSRTGKVVDNDATRLANARAMDDKIDADEERLSKMESEYYKRYRSYPRSVE